jgi:hypothetical protein
MELLATEFSDDTRYKGSHNAVANTWIVSFKQIQRNPEAAALLSFISFMEPKAIPRSMLPQAASEQRTTLAIGLLSGYSFLNGYNDGHTYDMHRLVHLASRVWVRRQPDAKKQWRAAMTHLESIIGAGNREFWELQLYIPHVLTAFKFWVLGADEQQNFESSHGFWAGKELLLKNPGLADIVKTLEPVEMLLKMYLINAARISPSTGLRRQRSNGKGTRVV